MEQKRKALETEPHKYAQIAKVVSEGWYFQLDTAPGKRKKNFSLNSHVNSEHTSVKPRDSTGEDPGDAGLQVFRLDSKSRIPEQKATEQTSSKLEPWMHKRPC